MDIRELTERAKQIDIRDLTAFIFPLAICIALGFAFSKGKQVHKVCLEGHSICHTTHQLTSDTINEVVQFDGYTIQRIR